jgi:geranylgeranyl diphosphate synthase, type I
MNMNTTFYNNILKELGEIDLFREWYGLYDLMGEVVAKSPQDWHLPLIACRAVGSDERQAYPAVTALALLQTAIIWVDDMLDHDPRGVYHRYGTGSTANMASALFMTGLNTIRKNVPDMAIQSKIQEALEQMVVVTALGQERDLQVPRDELGYWQVVKSKSVPFYSTSLYVGALLGGSSDGVAEQIRQLGTLYGEIVQISDDLHDSLEVPANVDWLQGRSSLPLLFAEIVVHPERAIFMELRKETADLDKLREAQAILLRCGAVSYCIDQIWQRYEQGMALLKSMNLPASQEVEALLEATVLPIRDLFSMLDANLLVVTPEI